MPNNKHLFHNFLLTICLILIFSAPVFGSAIVGIGPIVPSSYYNPPELAVSAPMIISTNEIFTVEATLLGGGSKDYSSYISYEIQLPKGFELLSQGEPNENEYFLWGKYIKYIFNIRAASHETFNSEFEVTMNYYNKDKEKITIKGKSPKIQVINPVHSKFKVYTNYVYPNYNGNIGLAAAIETLPSLLPLGFFVLGDKNESAAWSGTYAYDSLIPKMIETVAAYAIASEMSTHPGGAGIDSTKINICAGVYLCTLLFYDLPNIYKSHIARIEIAKQKREGQL